MALPERPYRLRGGGGQRTGRLARPHAAALWAGLPALPRLEPAARWERPGELPPAALHAFRYGVDLFNAGCWWEAHEVWEALWGRARRDSALAALLQGLILLAAALLQDAAQRPRGAARLAGRAAAQLATAAGDPTSGAPLGLPAAELAQTLAVALPESLVLNR